MNHLHPTLLTQVTHMYVYVLNNNNCGHREFLFADSIDDMLLVSTGKFINRPLGSQKYHTSSRSEDIARPTIDDARGCPRCYQCI